MSEPSVLDYLLSIIDPRKERIILDERLLSPDQNQDGIEELKTEPLSTVEEHVFSDDEWEQSKIIDHELPEIEIPTIADNSPFPWRILFVILSMVVGQLFLEPAHRNLILGLVFYVVAIGFLLISIFTGDWRFSKVAEETSKVSLDDWPIRWMPFVFGTISLITSFILFSGDEFNTGNIVFWLLAILFYFQAFSPDNILQLILQKVRLFFNEKIDFSKAIKIDWWTVLVVLVTFVIVFYRFFQLSEIPGEMFSDHAEKLMDVSDVLNGDYHVYFIRNTGREAFQMYLTVLMMKIFGTGISFMSLKLGTAFAGLFTLPFVYLLGKEIANKRVGLLAYFLAGIAYWPNVISRIGLRFPLYPLFAAPVIYFVIRGLRQQRKWDFIWAGFFLGVGLHGYSPARMTPIVVLAAILIYYLHKKTKEERIGSLYGLIVIILIAFVVFMPLLHYAFWNMDIFAYRAMTRMGQIETGYPGNPLFIFFSNFFKAMIMFFWDNGEVWVNSIPHRPALDIVSAVFYLIGSVYVFIRYIKERNWTDIFMLVSVPLLMMPSIMSLAFPNENPSLNRSSGAFIPVFILAAMGLEASLRTFWGWAKRAHKKPVFAYAIGFILVWITLAQNYALVFDEFKNRYTLGAWNYSEIADVISEFANTYGDYDHAYVVPFDYWVDTRIVGIAAQGKIADPVLWPQDFESTIDYNGAKLFVMKYDDFATMSSLQAIYPDGAFWRHNDEYSQKDFIVFFVPPVEQNFIEQQQIQ